MDALSEYFTAKHETLEYEYKENCLTIARKIACLLLDQNKKPYIMTLSLFEDRGDVKYYGPLMPTRYRGTVTFTRHYVCCCEDLAFDPIHPEPLKTNEYSTTLFGFEIPMQMFVATSGILLYLGRVTR